MRQARAGRCHGLRPAQVARRRGRVDFPRREAGPSVEPIPLSLFKRPEAGDPRTFPPQVSSEPPDLLAATVAAQDQAALSPGADRCRFMSVHIPSSTPRPRQSNRSSSSDKRGAGEGWNRGTLPGLIRLPVPRCSCAAPSTGGSRRAPAVRAPGGERAHSGGRGEAGDRCDASAAWRQTPGGSQRGPSARAPIRRTPVEPSPPAHAARTTGAQTLRYSKWVDGGAAAPLLVHLSVVQPFWLGGHAVLGMHAGGLACRG